MVWMVKRETRGCLVHLEKRGVLEEGVTKDPKETKAREEMSGFEVTRVTQDGTASREDPKERQETSAPWVSQAEMASLAAQETLGRMVALAEGALQELRATEAVLASQASKASRVPEAHRAHLVPLVPQA